MKNIYIATVEQMIFLLELDSNLAINYIANYWNERARCWKFVCSHHFCRVRPNYNFLTGSSLGDVNIKVS